MYVGGNTQPRTWDSWSSAGASIFLLSGHQQVISLLQDLVSPLFCLDFPASLTVVTCCLATQSISQGASPFCHMEGLDLSLWLSISAVEETPPRKVLEYQPRGPTSDRAEDHCTVQVDATGDRQYLSPGPEEVNTNKCRLAS